MAFSIKFDYRYDSIGFFDGSDRRSLLELAAAEWERHINDEFDDIPAGSVLQVRDPDNPSQTKQIVLGSSIDDLLIFVGSNDQGGWITQPDGSLRAQIGEAYSIYNTGDGDAMRLRIATDFRGLGPTTDYEPFVGSIAFNNNSEIDWSFDPDGPVAGLPDLYSTAVHEIGHILGLVSSPTYEAQITASGFGGFNSRLENGGAPIPLESDGHVLDGFAGDSVALDPLELVGVRKLPGAIDLALLADIGYEIDGYAKQGVSFEITTNGDDVPVFGSQAGDVIDGLAGNDQIQGNGGNDRLLGSDGLDTLFGGSGDDILEGGADNDQLQGNAGKDFLLGGADDDSLFGGTGYDTYVFEGDWGYDFVLDPDIDGALRFVGYEESDLTYQVFNGYLIITAGANRIDFFDYDANGASYDFLYSSSSDTVREGTDTSATLTTNLWQTGTIEAEPIAGDGVTSDLNGGFVDKDWYRVTLDPDRLYSFEAEALSLTTGIVFFRLYDGAGIAVGGTAEAEGSTPNFTYSTGGQSGSEAYYLAVSAGDTNNFDFRTATGDFRVRFTDDGPSQPGSQPPTASGSSLVIAPESVVPLDGNSSSEGLFTWSDPDGVDDVVSFTVADLTPGLGYLIFDGNQATPIEPISVADIGRWAFMAGAGGETDTLSFSVTDSVGNVSVPTAGVVTANDTPPPPDFEPPTFEEFEYHARVTAYGEGDLFLADGTPIFGAQQLPGSLANGYRIEDIDSVFNNIQGESTFYAVGLISADGTPVLAVRGTLTFSITSLDSMLDWWQNADPDGIGYSEVVAAWPQIHEWLSENSGAYIVGHSQGGAQAQLLASFAATGAFGRQAISDIGGVATFNSPGIDEEYVTNFQGSGSADGLDVVHFVSSGDLVSHAGERYLPGQVVYYDLNHVEGLGFPWSYFSMLKSAHAGQWSQQSIFDSISSSDQPIISDPLSYLPLTNTDNSNKLGASSFSHLYSGGRFDAEYFGLIFTISGSVGLASTFLGSAVGLPFLGAITGPAILFQLSTRAGTEALRQGVGEARDGPLNTVAAIVYLGELLISISDKSKAAAVDTISTTVGVGVEIAEQFYNSLIGLGSKVSAAIDAVAEWFQRKADLFLSWAEETWDGISSWSAEVWSEFKDLTVTAIEAIGNWTSERWSEIKEFSYDALSTLAGLSDAAWKATIDGTSVVLQKIGEFPDQMAQLGADAWDAMSDWTEEQWNAVADWTSDTWNEAKDFTAEVWENSRNAAAGYFNNLKDDVAAVVNAAVDTYNQAKQQVQNIRVEAGEDLKNFLESAEGFTFFRNNPDVKVIAAENGTATANSTFPAILVGSSNSSGETLTGSEQDDVFFPSLGGVLNFLNPFTQSTEARVFRFAEANAYAPDTGADIIFGTLGNLDGVVVVGFGADDTIFVSGTAFSPKTVSVTPGSALLDFDANGDGHREARVVLEGDYSGQAFEVASDGVDTVIRLAGAGATQLSASGERFITPDPGVNRVYGDAGDDVMATSEGADILSGGDGADALLGGAGPDILLGGLGSDVLTGGADADVFVFDVSDFGPGFTADFIRDFVPGEDLIELSGFGLENRASLQFVTVADGDAIDLGEGRFIVLEGLSGVDIAESDVSFSVSGRSYGLISTTVVHRLTEVTDRFITTDPGANEVRGGGGGDAIVGGDGPDILWGEAGDDVLTGGSGADRLIGGPGADVLTGRDGSDVFEFTAGEEAGFTADFITDFEVGEDTLLLEGFGFESVSDLSWTATASGIALQLQATHFVVFEGYENEGILTANEAGWVFI